MSDRLDWKSLRFEAIASGVDVVEPPDVFLQKYEELSANAAKRRTALVGFHSYLYRAYRHRLGTEHSIYPALKIGSRPDEDWAQLLVREFATGAESAVAEWQTTVDCLAIRAIEPSERADPRTTLTHDNARRISEIVLLGVGVTQLIFLMTGVVVLHPAAALLIGGVALVFRKMAAQMRRELRDFLAQSSLPTHPVHDGLRQSHR